MPRILVVDDDVPSLDFIKIALSEEGYEVASACNGDDGLHQVRSFRPDLILLDMQMPIVNGEAFIELYKDVTGRKVPIIAFSASGKAPGRATQLGVDDFLSKPFDLDHLLNCIEKHLSAATK